MNEKPKIFKNNPDMIRNNSPEEELKLYRSRLRIEKSMREETQKELEQREQFFIERQKQLVLRQKETEELRIQLEKQIAEKENELKETRLALEQEKELYQEENRKRLEQTSKKYVSDAIDLLSKKETEFHTSSKWWAKIGAGSLLFGIAFFGYVTISSFNNLPATITWEFITFSICKGLIAVALFAGLSKYSLLFSNSYMREALKNADRRHAINFGKFYLESYGAAADWGQIKEAFEHWNITGDNAFTKSEEGQLDVTSLEKVASAIEKISKSLPSFGKDKNS